MSHAGEAVSIGMGNSLGQVEREVIVEHRILGSPCQQRGYLQMANSIGDSIDCLSRWVLGRERHVSHELGDRVTILGVPVRGAIRLTGKRADTFSRQQQRAIYESPRAMANQVGQRTCCRDTNERGGAATRGDRDAGVAQHHAGKPAIGAGNAATARGGAERPPERDWPTPVVCRGHDWAVDL